MIAVIVNDRQVCRHDTRRVFDRLAVERVEVAVISERAVAETAPGGGKS